MPEINAGYVQSYETRFEMLLQQMESRLEACVDVRPPTVGKNAMVVDQTGTSEANEVTQRHQPVQFTDPPMDSRWVRPRYWYVAAGVDEPDLERRLTDPTGQFAKSQVAAMMRRKDDLIIKSFFGDALTGEDGATVATAANDGVTVIPQGAAGLTVEKWRAAVKALVGNEVDDEDEDLWLAVTSHEHDALLGQTQIINSDYHQKPVLERGRVRFFLGTNVKITNRLLTNANGDRRVPLWVKSGIVLQPWKGVSTKIQDRADLVATTQVKTTASFDATRTQGKKVVEIVCDII